MRVVDLYVVCAFYASKVARDDPAFTECVVSHKCAKRLGSKLGFGIKLVDHVVDGLEKWGAHCREGRTVPE